MVEPIKDRLARTPDPDEQWLWCIACTRFFHFTWLLDRDTNIPRCPFSDCHGRGWDTSIFFWDTFREPDDERWPAHAADLRNGMRSPEMDDWYEERRAGRIEALARLFEASPENHRAGGGRARYLRPFLKMSGDLCWDLTDVDHDIGFQADLARELVADLPVWAQTAELAEADEMLAELRLFFAFAERTAAVADAAAWHRFLYDDDIAAQFRHTMRCDHRLRSHRRRSPGAGSAPQRAARRRRR